MALRGFTFGPYELLARLPSSAPTQTFLSRQRGADSFKKLVCLRTLLPAHAKDESVVETFLAEARLAAHLNHPACVTIYDLGLERGAYFVSMEYVTGETLTSLVDAAAARGEPVPEPLVASIVASICDGLHAAHELRDASGRLVNLVHGDLSPRNLMITYEGYPKILDFGVASTKAEHRGRVRYAAPERLQQRPLDRRADVYSLGLVMFEMLAARALGPASADERTSWVLGAARAPKLSLLVPSLHPSLAAVVERALAPQREARFGTADELGEALRAYLGEVGFTERRTAIAELMRAHFEDRAQIRTRTLQKLLRGDCSETELEVALGARSVADLELLFDPPDDVAAPLPRGNTRAMLGAALRAPIAASIPFQKPHTSDAPQPGGEPRAFDEAPAVGASLAEGGHLGDERTDEVPPLPIGATGAIDVDAWVGLDQDGPDTIASAPGLAQRWSEPTDLDAVPRSLGAALPEPEPEDNPTTPGASPFEDEVTADFAARFTRPALRPAGITVPADATTPERGGAALPVVVPEDDTATSGPSPAVAAPTSTLPVDGRKLIAIVPPLEVRSGSRAGGTPFPKVHERVSAPAHTPLPHPELVEPDDDARVEPALEVGDTRRLEPLAKGALFEPVEPAGEAPEARDARRDTTAALPARSGGYVTRTAAIKMLIIGIALGMIAGVLIAAFALKR